MVSTGHLFRDECEALRRGAWHRAESSQHLPRLSLRRYFSRDGSVAQTFAGHAVTTWERSDHTLHAGKAPEEDFRAEPDRADCLLKSRRVLRFRPVWNSTVGQRAQASGDSFAGFGRGFAHVPQSDGGCSGALVRGPVGTPSGSYPGHLWRERCDARQRRHWLSRQRSLWRRLDHCRWSSHRLGCCLSRPSAVSFQADRKQ
mmetsp:Transcript_4361/g.7309  ORF Transcript_4361/g.7309 Transcript_4361/m.7309 type:complete len:201 (+) Transcript_4361:432-1034(+)